MNPWNGAKLNTSAEFQGNSWATNTVLPVLAQKSIRLGILSKKTAVDEIRLSNRAQLSCNAVFVHGF